MTILILAEHDNASLHVSTRHAVTAALELGGEVHVLLAGHGCQAAAQQAASLSGAAKVLVADSPSCAQPLAEIIAALLAKLAPAYSHIVATATTTGKDILPRAAALLGRPQVSEVIRIVSPDTFVRPIYAGNALETVRCPANPEAGAPVIATIRQSAFAAAGQGGSAPIEAVEAPADNGLSTFAGMEQQASERPDLTSARIVISGGRGLGSAENFRKLEALADRIGAGVGASRAAVDAGYVPNDYQVGQTGKVVAPELYIAVGISGAVQHLAGMKESKVIVAVNKDENAPIFEIADYGLVADWEVALPRLIDLLTAG